MSYAFYNPFADLCTVRLSCIHCEERVWVNIFGLTQDVDGSYAADRIELDRSASLCMCVLTNVQVNKLRAIGYRSVIEELEYQEEE
jgi:hypothetical protein